mmetsp:Transcript_91538/g.168156  ORF Transcript_91538/g.168156 Transcript_91538/m.168156 type:complete len:248 (-) Transcript_91538:89-832(-)
MAIIADHSSLLHDYKQRLDAQHSDRVQDFSPLQERTDKEDVAWAAWAPELDRSIATQSAQRVHAVAAVYSSLRQVNRSIELGSSEREANAAEAKQALDKQERELPSSIAAVGKRLSIESSKREGAIPAMTPKIDAYTHNATWYQPIEAFRPRVQKLSSERARAVAAVNDSMDSWTAFEDSLYFLVNIEDKMRNGICTYCLTCGGKWPESFGGVAAELHDVKRRAEHCEDGLSDFSGEEKLQVCCTIV